MQGCGEHACEGVENMHAGVGSMDAGSWWICMPGWGTWVRAEGNMRVAWGTWMREEVAYMHASVGNMDAGGWGHACLEYHLAQ